jgi:hypothetical protein
MATYIVNAPDKNSITLTCSLGNLTLAHASYFYGDKFAELFPTILIKISDDGPPSPDESVIIEEPVEPVEPVDPTTNIGLMTPMVPIVEEPVDIYVTLPPALDKIDIDVVITKDETKDVVTVTEPKRRGRPAGSKNKDK